MYVRVALRWWTWCSLGRDGRSSLVWWGDWHHVGAHECPYARLVGEGEIRGRVRGVGEQEPREPLGAGGGQVGVGDEASQVGGGERRGEGQHAIEAVEGERREHPLRLVGDHVAQGFVLR